MKHTLFIFALITATIQTFAQSPRIKLNQITKDSVTGSVLISSPSDSGMVYSRDFYVAYGADSVLILYGDTLAATSALSNYVTIDGTETITGAKTFSNTFTQSGGDANFDNNTLYVDESANNVGIGTSSPEAGYNMEISGSRSRLALLNTSGITGDFSQILFGNGINLGEYAEMIRFNNTKQFSIFNYGGDVFLSTYYSGGYRYDLFIKESNGNVGINTSSPAEKLHVVGNIVATGSITPSYSDYNLKTNISDLTNGLDLILDLKPKTFNFISDNNLGLEDDLIVGLIAQDVEQSLSAKPYLNSIIKQIGEYKAIDIHKIIPITIKAIQEQQAIIETQQTEINQLKTLITDLTNRLIILENK